MLRLIYAIRHAEAFEKEPHQADWARELTPKGKEDAEKAGRFLLKENAKIDLLITSHATRTHTTAKIIAECISYPIQEIVLNTTIYRSTAKDLLNIVLGTADKYSSIAMVGHNPTISAFANLLSKENIDGFSTCTVAAFYFQLEKWSGLTVESGRVKFIHSPAIL
jgi:phosphohistidine phosphatase